MLFFKHQIHLNERIRIIKTKIDDKMREISSIYNANPKASYLDSIKQNISKEVLKEYTALYNDIVIKVKDIHERECMNKLSSETKVILFYELCKLVKSTFNLFCVDDAKNIGSQLLEKLCYPNHKKMTEYEQKRLSEDKKKLTKEHLSFIPIKDIFIAILLHYCECKKMDRSNEIHYMLTYIFPEIESELSIYLHFMISKSNTVCQQGGKQSLKRKRRRCLKKKKTRKH